MVLYDQLHEDLITALRNHDEVAKNSLRGLKSAIDTAVKNSKKLSDDLVIATAANEIKRRRDAITMYEQAGAADRVASEQAEIDQISRYLPAQMSDDELQTAVTAAINESKATTMADMGKVMGILRTTVGAQADAATMARLVKEQLSPS